MQWVEPFVAHYGYFAIFALLTMGIVGPLIPDETILILAGILIHRGTLAWPLSLAAAFAGSVCGITLSYLLGRGGLPFVLRRVPPRYLDPVHRYFQRFGPWTLFFGYFFAGVRHFTALVAGMTRMPLPRFALFAYSGGFFWVAAFLALGYFLGDRWQQWARFLHTGAFAAVAVIAACVFFWHRFRSPSTGA